MPVDGAAIAASVLSGLGLMALVGWGLTRRQPAADWTAWSAAFYLPVANLALLYPAIAARALFTPEHNLYAPLAGLGVLLARAAAPAPPRQALAAGAGGGGVRLG